MVRERSQPPPKKQTKQQSNAVVLAACSSYHHHEKPATQRASIAMEVTMVLFKEDKLVGIGDVGYLWILPAGFGAVKFDDVLSRADLLI